VTSWKKKLYKPKKKSRFSEAVSRKNGICCSFRYLEAADKAFRAFWSARFALVSCRRAFAICFRIRLRRCSGVIPLRFLVFLRFLVRRLGRGAFFDFFFATAFSSLVTEKENANKTVNRLN